MSATIPRPTTTQTPKTTANPTLKPLTRVHNPPIAWPTMALWFVCILGWLGSGALAMADLMPLWLALPIASFSLYMTFTPMHDSAHRSFSKTKWINAFMGRLCGLMLFAPFAPFRYAHLRHHHHTNHPEKDPDFWSGEGPTLLLPLRWLTQDWHYYVVYGRAWSKRPIAERVETVVTLLSLIALVSWLTSAGYGAEVFLYWLLPTRLAVMLLAFLFDYLPHRPHKVLARKDPHRATHNIGKMWLSPIMLYQNYHLSHHLYPGVPFYRYKKAWESRFPTDQKKS